MSYTTGMSEEIQTRITDGYQYVTNGKKRYQGWKVPCLK